MSARGITPTGARIVFATLVLTLFAQAAFARTPVPSAPGNLSASATSTSQIGLTWTASTSSVGLSGYNVMRCAGAACRSFRTVASVDPTTTSYTDSGLSANKTYWYKVEAVDTAGRDSAFSNIASATTPASQQLPATPTVTSATSASGTVGTAFSYQITATNSPTSYGAAGLPAGLSVNSGNGLISGTPTTAGSSSVTLSATNSGGTGTATLALSVTGTTPQPQISATPSSASFGTVAVGNTNSQTITLRNAGNATLTFSQISVMGAGFNETGLSTSTMIGAGKSTTFNATFVPTTSGAASGSITLTTNGTPSPLVLNLSGTGQAATLLLSANPTGLSFGNVLDGNSSALTASLTNGGNSSVTISGVTVAGAGFSSSGVSNGTVLSPGQSIALTVTFAPTSGGAVSGASASVASNATNSPAAIALSGSGEHWVSVNWSASVTGGVTYNVLRGTSPGGEGATPLNSSPIALTSYTDTSVTAGQQYYYTIEAVNSTGTSAPSSETSANIPTP